MVMGPPVALVDHVTGENVAVLSGRSVERSIIDGEFANFHEFFRLEPGFSESRLDA